MEGRLRRWIDNATQVALDNKTECFVKQYNDYFVRASDGTEVRVDGEQTLGENIADAGGVNTAFRAWKEAEKRTGKRDQLLPGL